MSRKVVKLHVAVDTDELREWADKHADMRHVGVAQVLYNAAERLDNQILGVDRVRALHGECDARCGLCHECGAQLPCATLRALDGE